MSLEAARVRPTEARILAIVGVLGDRRSRMTGEIASPCRNVCRVSADGRLCEGCGRTLDEIGRWAAASDAERKRIVAAAQERLTALGPAHRDEGGT